jgi:hypothetical protein
MVSALLAKLSSLDARFKAVDPCRYARWLLPPSMLVIITLAPALYLWGPDGPFRVFQFPYATVIWTLSLPLAFFSYEGLVVTWRAPLTLSRKLAFSVCHLFAIALSLIPVAVQVVIIWAIGGVNGDR